MRVFFVLSVIFAVGSAAPQYSYDSGASQLSQGRGGDKYLPPVQAPQAPIISKKFYIISAPEDHSNDGKVKHLVLGRPQKTYRVIFIKAPGDHNANLKYSAQFAPNEEKTVIYVLTKKNNDLNAEDIATPAPSLPSKPDVFFIKYKTEEEAQHAQKEIQGEYDKLGGTSEISDEGQAPVHDVGGSLDSLNPDGSYNYRQVNSGSENVAQPLKPPSVPSQQYLPSILKV